MLIIKDLHASIDDKKILNGINLSIKPGELHAIMGRNGSGKSTLANIITGREDYDIDSGSILFNGKDLLDQSPEDRALDGVFMSFQYPVVIPGVNNTYFLKAALNSKLKHQGLKEINAVDFMSLIREKLKQVVFKVDLSANKRDIKKAVEELFKVKVTNVTTSVVKGKTKRNRFGIYKKSNYKKAFVSLSEDSDIQFEGIN